MDRGAWWATVQRVTRPKRLGAHTGSFHELGSGTLASPISTSMHMGLGSLMKIQGVGNRPVTGSVHAVITNIP